MAKAYTPGLKVSARTVYRARRMLPVPGDVLVTLGQLVKARDIVIGIVVGIFVVAVAASFGLLTVVLRPLSTVSRKMRQTAKRQI